MTIHHSTQTTAVALQRLPVFDVPHKGVRNALAQLSLLAGQTDYTTPAAVTRLYRLGKQVFRLLTLHATDENEVTLKHLAERAPGAAEHNLHEHEALEALQHDLEQQLEEMHLHSSEGTDVSEAGARFYQQFSELHALHLQHMLEEERETQPAVWAHFTDEELLGHRKEIIGRNKPEDLLLFFRFILPAQKHQERTNLLRGIQANAPAPFFTALLTTAQEVLPAAEFSQLTNAL
ncbi:MAG: hemerythrin domain-containing protein [Saprospiraceae bacterium]